MKSPNLRSRRPVPEPLYHRAQVLRWGSNIQLDAKGAEHGETWPAAEA